MSVANSVMVELMVPRDTDTERRIYGFYSEIGWNVYPDSEDSNFIYTQPIGDLAIASSVGYWLTANKDKIAAFDMHCKHEPSEYARGLRLPYLQDLVEISLVLPDDQAVRDAYKRGGALLAAHTHIGPRMHGLAHEFRFADPFNYSLRVTANPGYELTGTRVTPNSGLRHSV